MLKYEKEKEKAAFRAMTFREKLSHIFTYYRLPILGILIGIIAVFLILNRLIWNPPKKSSLSVGVTATSHLQLETDAFNTALCNALPQYVTDTRTIETIAFPFGSDDPQEEYYTAQKLMAMVAAQSLDVMLGSEDMMKEYAASEYFMDLSEWFSEAELDQMQAVSCEVIREVDDFGRVISAEGPYPLLLPLPSSELLQMEFGQLEPVYLAVFGNAAHPEAVQDLIRLLLG